MQTVLRIVCLSGSNDASSYPPYSHGFARLHTDSAVDWRRLNVNRTDANIPAFIALAKTPRPTRSVGLYASRWNFNPGFIGDLDGTNRDKAFRASARSNSHDSRIYDSCVAPIPTLPKSEELSPQPASPYAITKYVGECYCRVFTEIYDLETVALRYFNIFFGPRQDPDSPYSAVIAKFIYIYLQGNSPTIDGDGEQSRDFTYVANAVHANLLACHAEGVAGEVFNIGCGEQTSVNQLASIIGETMEADAKPVYGSPRPGDVRHSRADISKAQRLLGYKPQVDLKTGLRRTVDWFLE